MQINTTKLDYNYGKIDLLYRFSFRNKNLQNYFTYSFEVEKIRLKDVKRYTEFSNYTFHICE